MLWMQPQKPDETPHTLHIMAAIFLVLAAWSSFVALRYVAYPIQVVGKSAKPVMVMLLGLIFGRKVYSLQRAGFVLIIVVGVVLFVMKENMPDKLSEQDEGVTYYGEALLLASLVMDGMLGAVQERMRAGSAPSALQMMSAINGWSSILLIAAGLIKWEILSFLQFTRKYPDVWLTLIKLVTTGTTGQLLIFAMVMIYVRLLAPIVIISSWWSFYFLFIAGRDIRPIGVFGGNDNAKILHRLVFSANSWQCTDFPTMDWPCSCFQWTFCRYVFWLNI